MAHNDVLALVFIFYFLFIYFFFMKFLFKKKKTKVFILFEKCLFPLVVSPREFSDGFIHFEFEWMKRNRRRQIWTNRLGSFARWVLNRFHFDWFHFDKKKKEKIKENKRPEPFTCWKKLKLSNARTRKIHISNRISFIFVVVVVAVVAVVAVVVVFALDFHFCNTFTRIQLISVLNWHNRELLDWICQIESLMNNQFKCLEFSLI